jgi:CBS domain-containing protein
MPQTIDQVMTADPRTVAPDETIAVTPDQPATEAVRMRAHDVRRLVVLQDGRAADISAASATT